jgi:uncharacterized protein YcbK (DUF882 family)
MSDTEEIIVERIKKLKKPKAKDLVTSNYAAKGYNLKVLKHVEDVLSRLYDDLQQYPEFSEKPDMGTIVSAYRTAERQQQILDQAKKKYENNPEMLDNLNEYVADPGKNKVTPHMTGAALDFYLGHGIETENIKAIRKSKAYDIFSRHAYHNYKLAPLSSEPWHWECGDACKANIDLIIAEENAVAAIPQRSNDRKQSPINRRRNTLPPAVPSNTTNQDASRNDDYGLSQKEIMEIEAVERKNKNTLKFLLGGSILLTTYLITMRKR